VITILNAAPARPFETGLPEFIDILVVNAIEAEMLGGGNVSSLNQACLAAGRAESAVQDGHCDRRRRRVASCDQSGHRTSLPSLPVEVASTHGAGDCFVGTLAAAWRRAMLWATH